MRVRCCLYDAVRRKTQDVAGGEKARLAIVLKTRAVQLCRTTFHPGLGPAQEDRLRPGQPTQFSQLVLQGRECRQRDEALVAIGELRQVGR
jgi:hypothetical protein